MGDLNPQNPPWLRHCTYYVLYLKTEEVDIPGWKKLC